MCCNAFICEIYHILWGRWQGCLQGKKERKKRWAFHSPLEISIHNTMQNRKKRGDTSSKMHVPLQTFASAGLRPLADQSRGGCPLEVEVGHGQFQLALLTPVAAAPARKDDLVVYEGFLLHRAIG
jgi:hypothetical protein